MKIVLSKFGAIRYIADNGEQFFRLVDVKQPVKVAAAKRLALLGQVAFSRPTLQIGAASHGDFRVFDCPASLVCNAMGPRFSLWRVTHDMNEVFVIHVHSNKHYKIGKLRSSDGKISDKVMRLAERRANDLNRLELEWFGTPWRPTSTPADVQADQFGT